MSNGEVHTGGKSINMVSTAITTAGTVTGTAVDNLAGAKYLSAVAKFTYGSGGTTLKAYVQTSLDRGATWTDIMCFAFTTATASKQSAVSTSIALAAGVAPTDGTLADNTILNGLLGNEVRVKYVSVGTYVNTTFELDMVVKG